MIKSHHRSSRSFPILRNFDVFLAINSLTFSEQDNAKCGETGVLPSYSLSEERKRAVSLMKIDILYFFILTFNWCIRGTIARIELYGMKAAA